MLARSQPNEPNAQSQLEKTNPFRAGEAQPLEKNEPTLPPLPTRSSASAFLDFSLLDS
jgi:hypothetical protein